MTSLLTLDHISYRYRKAPILEDISFTLDKGVLMTILGPNGAGKSTLLKIILGLLRPSSGRIRTAHQLKIGYMPQAFAFNPYLPLTVTAFLDLTRHATLSQDAALSAVGMQEHTSMPMVHLSGGQLQRVLLARALMRQPDLFILDEPTQGLDPQTQRDFFILLDRLAHKEGRSVLMVSHDLYTVMSQSDEVICLNRHICCQGKPEVIRQDKASHTFLDHTIAPYHHPHHDHRHD